MKYFLIFKVKIYKDLGQLDIEHVFEYNLMKTD
jgi:hypothetical protein